MLAMIADTLDRLHLYLNEREARAIAGFISALTPETASGEHEIRGRDIYASVSRYETKPRGETYPEAHRVYTDVQFLLTGAEAIEWFTLGNLKERTAYDAGRDVAFYERPDAPDGIAMLRPGLFAIFEPEDGHMPQLRADGADNVTKVVIKLRR